LTSAPKTVTIDNGATVTVEAGRLLVPESRSKPTDRVLSIPYYRLRSESDDPATPVFLLAGGPGSSWIERFENEENYQEVNFYREFADVVLFDQRGGGVALPAMDCPQRGSLPLDAPLDVDAVTGKMQELAVQCRELWTQQGVDLSAFNTDENAADLDDLRKALGYEKISVIGGSYGSHLALHFMRLHRDRVDRAMLYGIEGPDHTWDDPGAMLSTLQRIARVAEQSEELGPHIPEGGLLEALRVVENRLEKEPVTVTLRRGDQEVAVVVDKTLVQLISRRRAGRRSDPNFWPELILAMYNGDFSMPAQGALALRNLGLQDPMHYMMDCASGISADRRKRYLEDPAASLLGNINLEYAAICQIWNAPDLGSSFRANVVSDIPTLIVHGTWDTSTPIENARETVASLKNGHLLEVEQGSHGAIYNLYENWPPMRELVRSFLTGGDPHIPRKVSLPAVEFQPFQEKGR